MTMLGYMANGEFKLQMVLNLPISNPKIKRLFWIILVGLLSSHESLKVGEGGKRRVRERYDHGRKSQGRMLLAFEERGKRPRAKERGCPVVAGKEWNRFFLRASRKGHSSAGP